MPEQLVIAEAKHFQRPQTPMDLLTVALNNNAAIDVIERLAALQEKAMARESEIEFTESLNRCQKEIPRIAPDMQNPDKHNKWASFTAIDKVIRPVYLREGLSLSFNTGDSPLPEHTRVFCYVSKGSFTRTYQTDMPVDTKGPKGGDVMTKTHATGAAMSYGMRYLLKYIFNIAIGEEDNDGNGTNGELAEALEGMENAADPDTMMARYKAAWAKFEDNAPALKVIVALKNKLKAEFNAAD